MKKLQIITLCVSLIMMGACRRDDSIDTTQTAKAMLLGKWQLEKTIDDYYQPVDVFIKREELAGEPDDSVIFKSNAIYSYKTRATGVDEDIDPYVWINDSIIKVDGEHFTIRKLTKNELTVIQDDTENGERTVSTAFYTR